MVELKTMSQGIKIEYTIGDLFQFVLNFREALKEDVEVYFEVSPNGTVPIISKLFVPCSNKVEIILTEEETNKLKVSRNHMYKLFLVLGDQKSCILSGTIKLKRSE